MTAIKSLEDADNPSHLFNMNKSLAAYAAARNAKEAEFQRKLNALNKAIEGELQEDIEEEIAVLATPERSSRNSGPQTEGTAQSASRKVTCNSSGVARLDCDLA